MRKQPYGRGLRKCYLCKKILELNSNNFKRNKSSSYGFDYECKKCANIKNKTLPSYQRNIKRRQTDKKYRYWIYQYNSKLRNKSWNLTFEDFESLWQKSCYYCGSKIESIGIDRIDNKIGYQNNNIIPCCAKCNRMKGQLLQSDFIKHCNKVSEFNARL